VAAKESNRLAWTPEGFDIERRSLDLSVHRYTFVLSTVEEVLTLVADKSPLRKRAPGVSARVGCNACWLSTGNGINVNALLLEQNLGRERKTRR
jgi:hypothetical protein